MHTEPATEEERAQGRRILQLARQTSAHLMMIQDDPSVIMSAAMVTVGILGLTAGLSREMLLDSMTLALDSAEKDLAEMGIYPKEKTHAN